MGGDSPSSSLERQVRTESERLRIIVKFGNNSRLGSMGSKVRSKRKGKAIHVSLLVSSFSSSRNPRTFRPVTDHNQLCFKVTGLVISGMKGMLPETAVKGFPRALMQGKRCQKNTAKK